MAACFRNVHDVDLLLADLIENYPTYPADERERKFFFGEEKQVDVAAFCRIIRAGPEKKTL